MCGGQGRSRNSQPCCQHRPGLEARGAGWSIPGLVAPARFTALPNCKGGSQLSRESKEPAAAHAQLGLSYWQWILGQSCHPNFMTSGGMNSNDQKLHGTQASAKILYAKWPAHAVMSIERIRDRGMHKCLDPIAVALSGRSRRVGPKPAPFARPSTESYTINLRTHGALVASSVQAKLHSFQSAHFS